MKKKQREWARERERERESMAKAKHLNVKPPAHMHISSTISPEQQILEVGLKPTISSLGGRRLIIRPHERIPPRTQLGYGNASDLPPKETKKKPPLRLRPDSKMVEWVVVV